MKDNYKPLNLKIINAKDEGSNTRLITVERKLNFAPGQFVIASVPGYGESPFVVCSSPNDKKYMQICVREVGTLTKAIHQLKKE